MIDIENEVINLISVEVEKSFPNIFISGERVRVPSSFPAITIAEVDNQQYRRTQSTDNQENHARIIYEINAFSNLAVGKKRECKAIMKIIDEAMSNKGFTRVMLRPIDNLADETIYRMVGRYRAVVSQNKTIHRG